MKTYNSTNIRNIAVAGHAGRGKTTLCEAMLYTAGATKRLGKVADGTTVMDYDPEEKKRQASLQSAVACLEWNDAGCMLIVMDAERTTYDVGAEKAFNAAEVRNLSKIFVINKTDAENANFGNVFEAMQEVHGNKLCPVVVPLIEEGQVRYLVNLSQNKCYEYKDGKSVEVDMPESDKTRHLQRHVQRSRRHHQR